MLLVYILEAHAVDEWPMGDGFGVSKFRAVKQPRSVEERCRLAAEFRDELQSTLPLCVDGVDNAFESLYSVWPLRFYVVHKGRITFKAQPTKGCRYDIADLIRACDAVLNN